MKEILLYILGTACLGLFIYGSYSIAKTVSYSVFYEDMVNKTIDERVEQSCLRQKGR